VFVQPSPSHVEALAATGSVGALVGAGTGTVGLLVGAGTGAIGAMVGAGIGAGDGTAIIGAIVGAVGSSAQHRVDMLAKRTDASLITQLGTSVLFEEPGATM